MIFDLNKDLPSGIAWDVDIVLSNIIARKPNTRTCYNCIPTCMYLLCIPFLQDNTYHEKVHSLVLNNITTRCDRDSTSCSSRVVRLSWRFINNIIHITTDVQKGWQCSELVDSKINPFGRCRIGVDLFTYWACINRYSISDLSIPN